MKCDACGTDYDTTACPRCFGWTDPLTGLPAAEHSLKSQLDRIEEQLNRMEEKQDRLPIPQNDQCLICRQYHNGLPCPNMSPTVGTIWPAATSSGTEGSSDGSLQCTCAGAGDVVCPLHNPKVGAS